MIKIEDVERTYNNHNWIWEYKPLMLGLLFICQTLLEIKNILIRKDKK